MNDEVTIRSLTAWDAQAFSHAFAGQGWHKPESQFLVYLEERGKSERQVFVAELRGLPVGYVCLLPEAPGGPFKGKGIPCISDFNVLMAYQRLGIGTLLMDAVEQAAFLVSDRVCIGVGMHSGYGSAQRMYVKRGYVPDGSGLWYRDDHLAEGAACANDDELVLYFSKRRATM